MFPRALFATALLAIFMAIPSRVLTADCNANGVQDEEDLESRFALPWTCSPDRCHRPSARRATWTATAASTSRR